MTLSRRLGLAVMLAAALVIGASREMPKTVTATNLSTITGYYCYYNGGYYGDGGGWCVRPTSSGWHTIDAANREATVGRRAAACGTKWSLGTILAIHGYMNVVCYDRGHLAYDQVDVFYIYSLEAPGTFSAEVTSIGYDPYVVGY